MIKKVVIVLLVLAVSSVAVFKLFFEKGDLSQSLNDVKQNMSAYHMEGSMTLYNGEDSRGFVVKVSYKKNGNDDFFRVSLLDLNINQEQIIIRNDKGVFILTPSLNQVFEFQGNWPLNSPKPYIYQSMLDVFSGEHQVKKMDDGFLVTNKPNYVNSPQWAKQEIKFSENLKPLWLHIYDANDALKVKLTFNKVDMNPKFNDDYFEVDANMKTALETSQDVGATSEDLPLFPANATIESTLKDQTTATVNGKSVHILTYDGAKPFTVIQRLLEKNKDTVVEVVNGEIIDILGGMGIYESKTLKYCYNGVEYKIFSDVLTKEEMIEVANGMEVVITK